jgi:hypothetical protein
LDHLTKSIYKSGLCAVSGFLIQEKKMRFSLMFSLALAIALVSTGPASALELSRTLPAADITQTPYEVRFLIFDGPEATRPIEIAGFVAGEFWLEEVGEQVVISAEFLADIDPKGLWIETELDGQIMGARVALEAAGPPRIFFGPNANLRMDGNTITGLAMPPDNIGKGTDAVNRSYVDTSISAPIPGVSTGDLQYFNGAAWVLISAGHDESRLSICDGVLAWTTHGCVTYKVGDIGPALGRVIYIKDGGRHGLEVSLEDQSTGAPWGCKRTDISGANPTAVETGESNTAAILAACSDTGIAAKLADDYEQNGFQDYFLPSKDELHLIYQQKHFLHGINEGDYYWSSSQFSTDKAWAVYFRNGDPASIAKSLRRNVRAIRSF